MNDLISRQAAIDALRRAEALTWAFGYHNVIDTIRELPSAQPEITDEQAIEHLQSTGWMQNHDREMYESGLREQLADDSGAYDSLVSCEDAISRQAAIDSLWKALHEYEDKTEKQFQESEDLDVGDWIEHRIFVQNMNDIDRQTILNLPSAHPEIIRCKDCKHAKITADGKYMKYCSQWDVDDALYLDSGFFCGHAERRTDE